VLELNPFSGGLSRNIRQCLQDFRIPVRIRETVVEIKGRNRLSSIVAAKVDEKGTPIPGTEYEIPCDLLILSVGLIPENEVAREAGIALEDRTNNVITDAFLQTNRPGIFSCGNSRKVHDLADYVTGEGVLAGKNAAAYVLGKTPEAYDEKKK
jgi:thioredoxin reductase